MQILGPIVGFLERFSLDGASPPYPLISTFFGSLGSRSSLRPKPHPEPNPSQTRPPPPKRCIQPRRRTAGQRVPRNRYQNPQPGRTAKASGSPSDRAARLPPRRPGAHRAPAAKSGREFPFAIHDLPHALAGDPMLPADRPIRSPGFAFPEDRPVTLIQRGLPRHPPRKPRQPPRPAASLRRRDPPPERAPERFDMSPVFLPQRLWR